MTLKNLLISEKYVLTLIFLSLLKIQVLTRENTLSYFYLVGKIKVSKIYVFYSQTWEITLE